VDSHGLLIESSYKFLMIQLIQQSRYLCYEISVHFVFLKLHFQPLKLFLGFTLVLLNVFVKIKVINVKYFCSYFFSFYLVIFFWQILFSPFKLWIMYEKKVELLM
jgi:hypothetical protein